MSLESKKKAALIRSQTGIRLSIKEWESIDAFLINESSGMIVLTTFEVKDLVRETRYNRKGTRVIQISRASGRWKITDDDTLWDEEFEPWVYVKFGNIKTSSEQEEQREWEKMCYRPGNRQVQLDSYERVCDPLIRSTEKMERYY